MPACILYGERVAPVTLPISQSNHVDVMEAKLAAFPYVDEDSAEAVLDLIFVAQDCSLFGSS